MMSGRAAYSCSARSFIRMVPPVPGEFVADPAASFLGGAQAPQLESGGQSFRTGEGPVGLAVQLDGPEPERLQPHGPVSAGPFYRPGSERSSG